jgi:small-conductance mechanosensitive channel
MKLNFLSEWIRAALPIRETLNLKSPDEPLPASETSRYQSSNRSIAGEAKNQIDLNRKSLTQELSHPEPKVLEKLSEVNQKRSAKGLAPIDLPKVTKQLEAIYKDSHLSEKQKKEKIEQLRKQLGLSKGEMKALFTKRIEAAYKNAEKRLAAFEQAKSNQLKSELQRAEASYGKDSAQAKAVRDKLDSLKSSLQSERESLKAHAKFFGSLYPSFWSKLGSAFKKIGQGLAKALSVLATAVRFIPALGPVVSSALRSVQSLFQGKLGQFGKSLLGLVGSAKNLLPMIPGVGAIAGLAVNGIEAVIKATRQAKPL